MRSNLHQVLGVLSGRYVVVVDGPQVPGPVPSTQLLSMADATVVVVTEGSTSMRDARFTGDALALLHHESRGRDRAEEVGKRGEMRASLRMVRIVTETVEVPSSRCGLVCLVWGVRHLGERTSPADEGLSPIGQYPHLTGAKFMLGFTAADTSVRPESEREHSRGVSDGVADTTRRRSAAPRHPGSTPSHRPPADRHFDRDRDRDRAVLAPDDRPHRRHRCPPLLRTSSTW